MFKIPGDLNPKVYILWLLRNERVTDWTSLVHELGLEPDVHYSPSWVLLDYLHSLQKAGLITLEGESGSKSYSVPSGRIKLTGRWPQIQATLDLSLTELTKLGRSAIIVTPYFGKPEQISDATDLFVLMPFDPQLRPVYEDHIARCASELHLSITRGDDFFTARSVMNDIWNAINNARAIIADCTGRNPNVFYEIGLAHAVGKPVILIAQTVDDVPFDIRHLRYILYDYTPRGMQVFEKRLLDTLRTELSLDRGKRPVRRPVLFIVGDESEGSLTQLRQEFTAIESALGHDKMFSEFPYSQHYIPNLDDAMRSDDFRPSIVHIVGHPGGPDALMANGEMSAHSYEASELATVMRPAAQLVRCVILSACFSEPQADAIASEIPYVIGIHADIGGAATSFAVEFYQSLSAGRSIAEAHEIANSRVRLEGIPEDRLPTLISRN